MTEKKTPDGKKKKNIKEQYNRIIAKYGRITAVVVQSRTAVFQPIRKPKQVMSMITETPWAYAKVTGKIGQEHRDVLDVIMVYGEQYERGKSHELYVIIDPAKIRKIINISHTKLLNTLLEDMRLVNVNVTAKNHKEQIIAGIISEVKRKAIEIDGPGGLIKKRYLWQITISEAWMKLFDDYTQVLYANVLPIIFSMSTGYAQAIARFCITQNSINITFKDCLKAVGISREAKLVKRDMKNDLDKLEEIGITIDGDMVRYKQKPGLICFMNPPKLKLPKPTE